MGKVFELLEDIEYEDIDHLEFDGDHLWLPAKG
jgi:hypothetical protein